MLYAPLFEENLSYSATLLRQLPDALWNRQGVISAPDLKVTQRSSGANMSVDVSAGKAVVQGTSNSIQGKYLCLSDAVTNVPIATAPGTGNSRIDIIVAQVRDDDQDSGGNSDWIITAITGTPGSSPSVPAQPASSRLLAQIAVGANVTTIVNANISDKRLILPTLMSGAPLASSVGLTVFGPVTSGSYVDIDATALLLSLVAPPSGQVKLTFEGLVNNGTTGVRAVFAWVVSSGTAPGAWRTGNIDGSRSIHRSGLWTGLTPGVAVTAKLQWAYYNTSGSLTLGDGVDQWMILAEGA